MAAAAETLVSRELVGDNAGEELRSFDPLASVDLLRFDIIANKQVQPETMQRVMDEELTYIAEGIDRPLKTSFTLKETNGQLSYFDRGEWRPYTGMLLKGLKVAEQEALADPRKDFLAERAADDLAIGYKMQKLRAGEKLSWYSPFPENELQRFGKEFISSLGFQPSRRMAFLYQATRLSDGSLQLDSQTVDNNNSQGFRAAMNLAERDQSASIVELCGAYDKVLQIQSGLPHHAGKSIESTDLGDAWETIQKHRDILEYFFDGIMAIAENFELSRDQRQKAKKELTYGVWATLKTRLYVQQTYYSVSTNAGLPPSSVHYEVQQAYTALSSRGEVLRGCGGTIRGEKDVLELNAKDVFDEIFGKPDEEPESYEFDKFMHCVVCQAPPKRKDESKKMCGPCGICKGCDIKLSSKIK